VLKKPLAFFTIRITILAGGKTMNIEILQNTVLALLKAAPGLGSIHINKGLLIIDAYHHSLYLKTLTGINYVKHDLGPVPESKAHMVLFEMELDKIKVCPEKKGPVHTLNAHYALSEPDCSLFTQTSIDIINETADMIKHMSASRLSRLTHNKVWEDTPKGQIIPIESAYSIQIISRKVRKLTNSERYQAKTILEGLYGSTASVLPAAH
jgi:hypothetical protein